MKFRSTISFQKVEAWFWDGLEDTPVETWPPWLRESYVDGTDLRVPGVGGIPPKNWLLQYDDGTLDVCDPKAFERDFSPILSKYRSKFSEVDAFFWIDSKSTPPATWPSWLREIAVPWPLAIDVLKVGDVIVPTETWIIMNSERDVVACGIGAFERMFVPLAPPDTES